MSHNYPIILGHEYRKGFFAYNHPDGNGMDLYIVRLNREIPSGESFGKEDVEKVEVQLIFSDRRTIEALAILLNKMLLKSMDEDSKGVFENG